MSNCSPSARPAPGVGQRPSDESRWPRRSGSIRCVARRADLLRHQRHRLCLRRCRRRPPRASARRCARGDAPWPAGDQRAGDARVLQRRREAALSAAGRRDRCAALACRSHSRSGECRFGVARARVAAALPALGVGRADRTVRARRTLRAAVQRRPARWPALRVTGGGWTRGDGRQPVCHAGRIAGGA